MNTRKRINRRFGRTNGNHSPISLLEISRKNLVGKTKSQSPQRYRRKANYRAKAFDGIDVNELFNTGELVARVPVGDYICTVAYGNIFKELWKVVTAQSIPQITLQSCIKALQRSIDNEDILVDCQCPDFCLHGDTKIKLLNGEVITVKELMDRFNNGDKLWVYSVDEKQDFKPGEVTDVWISGYVNEMIKVTLDNGESIITTPNHRYMLRTGEYAPASDLEVGQSLMPLYFRYSKGYESVKLNSNPKAWVSVYKTVANILLSDEIECAKQRTGEDTIVIHHSDFNKLNNYPNNLKPMGKLEHWNYHASISMEDTERYEKWRNAGLEYWRSEDGRKAKSDEMRETMKKFWDSMSESERKEYAKKSHAWLGTDEGRKKISDGLKNYWKNLDDETRAERYKQNSERLNGINGEISAQRKKDWWKNATLEQTAKTREQSRKNIQKVNENLTDDIRKVRAENLRKTARANHIKDAEFVIQQVLNNNLILNEENYNKYRRSGDPKFNTAVSYGLLENYNHKIVSIEYINYNEPIPVYDLTVDKYNNFYVNAGVILHNCYRFAYWATKYGYKYGKPETRPAKITNPHDSIGAMCKHLTCLLANKRWLVKLAVSLNKLIQDNYDELENVMDMDGIIKLDRGQSTLTYIAKNKKGSIYTHKKEPDEVEDDSFIEDEPEDTDDNENEEDTDSNDLELKDEE